MDIIDQAEHHEQQSRDIAIKQAQLAAQAVTVNDTGHCWECGYPVPDTRRWCSPDCRDEAGRE